LRATDRTYALEGGASESTFVGIGMAMAIEGVSESHVEIVFGSHFRCRFARSSIASVQAATWRSVPEVATGYVNCAKPLEPNVTIVLAEPVYPKLPLGIRKRVSRIDVRLVDAAAVIEELNGRSPSS
jgi:hypothetical protein